MIKQYITDATRKCAQHTLADFGNINSLFLPTVKVNLREERQSILGFGAAMTDASCYNLGRMPEQERQALIQELFGPEGLNLSVARLPLGSSDYACKCYCCDDTPEDLELKDCLSCLHGFVTLNKICFLFKESGYNNACPDHLTTGECGRALSTWNV